MRWKRMVALLLCLGCMFALSACGSKKSKLVGRWEAAERRSEYIEFFSDGTWVSSGEPYEGTWSVDGDRLRIGAVLEYDTVYTFEIKGKTLILDYNGYQTEFVKA